MPIGWVPFGTDNFFLDIKNLNILDPASGFTMSYRSDSRIIHGVLISSSYSGFNSLDHHGFVCVLIDVSAVARQRAYSHRSDGVDVRTTDNLSTGLPPSFNPSTTSNQSKHPVVLLLTLNPWKANPSVVQHLVVQLFLSSIRTLSSSPGLWFPVAPRRMLF